ncbi:hypothetical protein TNIN_143401 [Trichonephila inaurata madagascariensis]|uniref:Uncharacterized protein n=1 Tax=Trichonephila inaurata madagascariensis TaxID=2747483 RepID=A0A8X6YFN0_9ARAC|nr:hypothetical protein TNIN_143401 [Trichonephila inaurata madagascariensis]
MLAERRQERETLVRELKILPPCTEPDCPEHSSSAQEEIEEKNTIKISQAADSLKQLTRRSKTSWKLSPTNKALLWTYYALTDEQKCTNLQSIDKQIRIFAARKTIELDIEKSIPSPTTKTTQKLEADAASLEEKIKALEGNMIELLPCPVPLCSHNFKYKNAKKRAVEPIIRPAKLTVKNNADHKKNKLDDDEFKIPRKRSKTSGMEGQLSTLNAEDNSSRELRKRSRNPPDFHP